MMGDGSFDTGMEFGYEVYLLVKHNEDGTVNIGMPNRNYEGVLVFDMKQINVFKPAYYDMSKPKNGEKATGGWTDIAKDASISNSATVLIKGQPRTLCRYSTEQGNTQYGYIAELDTAEKVCATGENNLIKSSYNQWQQGFSKPYQFQYLDLRNNEKRGEVVTALRDAKLCVVEHPEYDGVGYVSSNGQCVQDNVYWKGSAVWKFNPKDYTLFKYY